ncbi:MAG: neutral/alkaline non-lysosomal ceramidase N-terminal domain-containing protein, partial [Planctomycetes bacterium]|nr:neutral/alkaline non-lysosomal ceramidase N-terminal domain-containing protein [Planctomycetota bacterium]
MKPASLALLFLAAPVARAADGFLAGAAKVDITPDGPIRLSGYGSRTLPSEGVEDPISARALVLKDSEGVLTVLVSVDAIGIPARVRDRVVGAIRWRTGIYHVRLALAATHTHYAPVIEGSLRNLFVMTPDESKAVRRYTDSLVERIVQAIDGALAHLEPASVAYGKGSAGFAANRRTPGGPADHAVPVLAVRSAAGKLLAAAFGYACHATTVQDKLNRVSGDWPGRAAAHLEESYPGAVALPLIGCGADQNPHPRGELELSRRYGKELADAVEALLGAPLRPLPPRIDAQLENLELRFERATAREDLEALAASGSEPARRLGRRWLEKLGRGEAPPASYKYPVQVWSFGEDLLMVFLAGEVVVDYSIRLRRELAPREAWVTAYANDIPGYIPSRRVHAEGGYEGGDSMVVYDLPSRWDASIEEDIVGKVKALVPEGPEAYRRRVKPPPPREPREALETFRLVEGLRIELAAAEPEVTDPVAIAFDEEGRMYVAEMRDYPLGPGEGKPAEGRVRVLEDRDLDGYYERSSVLAEAVPYANGIACSRGGVFVTAVPDILYLKDSDGDGRADVRKVVYTGFRPGNSQHLVNSLEHGPDNWIHSNGGDMATVRLVDPPWPRPEGAKPVADLPLLHTNLRFDPRTLEVEAESGYRGGFGIAFDEVGSRFVCDNQSHAVNVVLERPDLGRNPHLRIDETMAVITDHGAAVYPVSQVLERLNDPQDYGRFSSACGVCVYGGDNLPAEHRGCLFSCEPVSNLVHRDVLVPSGSTYVARRGEGEADRELLASTDHWFRPVNLATGPDGALYVADMYREVIEHPEWIPEHLQHVLDLKAGMDRGRIWRIAGAPVRRTKLELAVATEAELAASLAHPSSWRRRTAQRLLVERGGAAAAREAARVLEASPSSLGRLHALWTLDGLGALERPAML